jgi:hypothetical protein
MLDPLHKDIHEEKTRDRLISPLDCPLAELLLTFTGWYFWWQTSILPLWARQYPYPDTASGSVLDICDDPNWPVWPLMLGTDGPVPLDDGAAQTSLSTLLTISFATTVSPTSTINVTV